MDHGPSATSDPGAALRNADDVLVRVTEDQAAADAARERYRREPPPSLPADELIGPLLLPDERVVAVRASALLERRQPIPGARAAGGIGGALYVTSRRLILVGRPVLSFGLETLQEVLFSGERLLLVLRDGQGVVLDVPQPRLLRVELAAARTAAQVGQVEPRTPQPASR